MTNKCIDKNKAELTARIDETNKGIDETRAELKEEIPQNTQGIDSFNLRVHTLPLRWVR